MIQTEPCPARPDGSAHQCINCSQTIAAGAPVLSFGRSGYGHYPSCDGSSSPAPVPAGQLDNGDKVAAAMGLPGSTQPPAQPVRAASNKSAQDLVAEAMGLTTPTKTQE